MGGRIWYVLTGLSDGLTMDERVLLRVVSRCGSDETDGQG